MKTTVLPWIAITWASSGFGKGHALARGVVLDLVLVDLADAEVKEGIGVRGGLGSARGFGGGYRIVASRLSNDAPDGRGMQAEMIGKLLVAVAPA